MALTRDELFEFKKRRIEKVLIPDAGEVLIRNLNEKEYMGAVNKAKALFSENGSAGDATNYVRSALVQFSVVDEKGNLEFSDHPDTTKAISQMDSRVVDLLVDAIEDHNSFADTEDEQADLEKKSGAIPAAGSLTS